MSVLLPNLARCAPLFCLLGAAPLSAQAPLWNVVVPAGDLPDWGARIGALGDLDADGVVDFFAVSPSRRRIEVRTGASGALIRLANLSPLPPGIGAAALADLDGDGVRELGIFTSTALRVVNGRTGVLVRSEPHPPSASVFRQAWLAALGDLDGDGIGDHVVSFSEDEINILGQYIDGGPGYVECRSGATGARLHVGPSAAGILAFGGYCAAIGDANGDGIDDYVVGSGSEGRTGLPGWHLTDLLVVSGSSGGALALLPSLMLGGSGYRMRAVGVGDADGDGRDDFVVANPQEGALVLVSGRTYQALASHLLTQHGLHYHPAPHPQHEAQDGSVLIAVPDVDGDGVVDLWVGSPMPRLALPTIGFEVVGPGQVTLHSGRTLARLQVIVGDGWSESFGAGLVSLGDVDGDGYDDLIVGAPFTRFGVGALRGVSGSPVAGQPYASCVGSYRGPVGANPIIGHVGSTSVGLDQFSLTLRYAEPTSFAFLQGSPTLEHRVIGNNVAGPLTVCLGNPLVRASGVFVTTAQGTLTASLPLGGTTPFLAGATWSFQWLYRASVVPFELSNALTVTWTP